MKIIEEIEVDGLEEKTRLSNISFQKFAFIHSRKALVKAIKRGDILLNGNKAFTGNYVHNQDIITVIEQQERNYKAYQRKLDVVYEDDYLFVINKPAGIDVSGNKFRTIENMVLANITLNKSQDSLNKFRPVHRLDNQTSGLLLFAKTSPALINLSKQFENHEVSKYYTAIVSGDIPPSGTIDFPINNASALTKYKVISYHPNLKVGKVALVKIQLFTGRTHQIRIHMASIGHPVLGDKLHGNNLILKGKGLFLTASNLSFTHPITHQYLNFSLPLPYKFSAYIAREEARFNKYQ